MTEIITGAKLMGMPYTIRLQTFSTQIIQESVYVEY